MVEIGDPMDRNSRITRLEPCLFKLLSAETYPAFLIILSLLSALVLPLSGCKRLTARDYVENAWAEKDLDAKIVDYTKAIELDPEYSIAYCSRGFVKRNKGDLDGAIVDLTRAIEINPKDAYAYFVRGAARGDKADWNDAIADYSKAIELNPKDANAYCYRGKAKLVIGDLDGAIADGSTAIRLCPNFACAYQIRGDAQKAKGALAGAEADFAEDKKLRETDRYLPASTCRYP